MGERLQKITNENIGTTQNDNLVVARRRFLLLLYARYVCFRVFLECAATTDGGITENDKGRWLLIQVAPITLLGKSDIFLNALRRWEEPPRSISRRPSDLRLSSLAAFYRDHPPWFACSVKRRLLQRTWTSSDLTSTLNRVDPSSVQSWVRGGPNSQT